MNALHFLVPGMTKKPMLASFKTPSFNVLNEAFFLLKLVNTRLLCGNRAYNKFTHLRFNYCIRLQNNKLNDIQFTLFLHPKWPATNRWGVVFQ